MSKNVPLYPTKDKDVSHLTILSEAKAFLEENESLNAQNLHCQSKAFVAGHLTTPEQKEAVSKLTVGQHTGVKWHEMRHLNLMVIGENIKSIYTRQKPLKESQMKM